MPSKHAGEVAATLFKVSPNTVFSTVGRSIPEISGPYHYHYKLYYNKYIEKILHEFLGAAAGSPYIVFISTSGM